MVEHFLVRSAAADVSLADVARDLLSVAKERARRPPLCFANTRITEPTIVRRDSSRIGVFP